MRAGHRYLDYRSFPGAAEGAGPTFTTPALDSRGTRGEATRDDLRGGGRRAPLGGPRALQHRRRRLRQAPARQAGDGVGGLPRRRSARSSWGELQSLSNRAANVLRAHGVERGDRVAVVAPATPETAAIFFGTWKIGAILLSMSVLYGDEGIRHRVSDSQAKLIVCSPDQAERMPGDLVDEVLVLDDDLLAGADDRLRDRRHLGRRPGPALLLVGHHRAGEGHPPRPPLHPRPRGVRLLPRRPRRRAASTAWASGRGRRGSPRCSGRGASAPPSSSTSARAASTRTSSSRCSSRHGVTNVFTTPTAMRAMMAIEDAGERYPQKFRIVCSAGEPLNPEAIRWFREQYGVTVLDYYGLTESYPLCANFPFMEVREGSMGKADAGLGRARSSTRTSSRSPRASAARSACARARTRTTRSATGTTRRPPRRPSAASGSTPRTPRSRTRTATSGTPGRADDVIISAGYRIGPFEVESACIEHPAVREAAAVASPDEKRGHVVKAFVVLRRGARALRRAGRRDQELRPRPPVRLRLSRARSSSSTTCRRR